MSEPTLLRKYMDILESRDDDYVLKNDDGPVSRYLKFDNVETSSRYFKLRSDAGYHGIDWNPIGPVSVRDNFHYFVFDLPTVTMADLDSLEIEIKDDDRDYIVSVFDGLEHDNSVEDDGSWQDNIPNPYDEYEHDSYDWGPSGNRWDS